MKKYIVFLFLLSLTVLTYNQPLMAEESLLEERWKDFLTTSEFEYNPGNGLFSMVGLVHFIGTTDATFWHAGLEGEYTLNENLAVNGAIVLGAYNQNESDNDLVRHQFSGGAKYKFYRKNDITLAILGYMDGAVYYSNPNNLANIGTTLFFTKEINSEVTLHSNLNLFANADYASGILTNSVQYQINNQHALKVALYTRVTKTSSFHSNHKATVAYKGDFLSDQLSYLFEYYTNFGSHRLVTTLETRIIPNFIATAQVDLNTYSNELDIALINLEQRLGPVTLSEQIGHSLPSGDDKTFIVKGEADWSVTPDLSLVFDFDNIQEVKGFAWESLFRGTLSLEYKI